jgi:hypothetical protein
MQLVQRGEVALGMRARQRLAADVHGLVLLELRQQPRGLQVIHDRRQARRRLRVPVAHVVAGAMLVREKTGRHS